MADTITQKKENARYLLNTMATWIENFDKKTSYAMTLASALLGVILTKGRPTILGEIEKASTISCSLVLGVGAVSLLYIFSLTTIIMFLLAICCRIKPSHAQESLLFFGTIQSFELDLYIKKSEELSESEYIRQLYEQIHTNSSICNKKAKCFNHGIFFMGITFSLFLVCLSFGYL